jgi:exonuclease III
VDVFRHFHPDARDQYTRRSYRAGARPRNIWRRLDYVTVSRDLLPQVTNFTHQQNIMGSDHCPVSVILS